MHYTQHYLYILYTTWTVHTYTTKPVQSVHKITCIHALYTTLPGQIVHTLPNSPMSRARGSVIPATAALIIYYFGHRPPDPSVRQMRRRWRCWWSPFGPCSHWTRSVPSESQPDLLGLHFPMCLPEKKINIHVKWKIKVVNRKKLLNRFISQLFFLDSSSW